MEFQPEGKVCLTLKRDGLTETYTWNKVGHAKQRIRINIRSLFLVICPAFIK